MFNGCEVITMAATKESKLKHRGDVEFFNSESVNQTEIVQKLKNVYKEDAVDHFNVSLWLKRLLVSLSHCKNVRV